MPATPRERRIADELDRERSRLDRIGVREAERIGRAVRIAAIKAFRAGRDVMPAIFDMRRKMTGLLIDGMVAGHLAGRANAFRRAEKAPRRGIELSVYNGQIQFLRTAARLTVPEVSAIRS